MKKIKNKKALFDYELIESFEAGIILEGNEVKSIRSGKISINEAFISIENNEVFIKKFYIKRYEHANTFKVLDETRVRKLLLKKSEIQKLSKQVKEKGLTIIPLSVNITDRGLIKLSIFIGKGKNAFDKRNSLKKKSQELDKKQALKDMNRGL